MICRSIRSLIPTALVALTALMAIPQSAGAQDASPAACPPLSPDLIQAVAQEFVGATDAEDVDRLRETLHESYVHHWGAGPDVFDRDGYLATLGNLFDAFDDFAFTADEIIKAGDIAVLRVTVSGKQVLAFAGFPPTGKPTTWTGIYIFEFDECGRIAETWAEFDHLGRLIQQGSIEPSEATPAQ
jgi:steroid delta-isomerase-like uncharacterized protein